MLVSADSSPLPGGAALHPLLRHPLTNHVEQHPRVSCITHDIVSLREHVLPERGCPHCAHLCSTNVCAMNSDPHSQVLVAELPSAFDRPHLVAGRLLRFIKALCTDARELPESYTHCTRLKLPFSSSHNTLPHSQLCPLLQEALLTPKAGCGGCGSSLPPPLRPPGGQAGTNPVTRAPALGGHRERARRGNADPAT